MAFMARSPNLLIPVALVAAVVAVVQPARQSPVLHWPFEGASAASRLADASGNGLGATLGGTAHNASWAPGVVEGTQALRLAPTWQTSLGEQTQGEGCPFVLSPALTAAGIRGMAPLTLAMWLRPDLPVSLVPGYGAWVALLGFRDPLNFGPARGTLELVLLPGQQLLTGAYQMNLPSLVTLLSFRGVAGEWMHVAAAYGGAAGGASLSLYLNGALAGSFALQLNMRFSAVLMIGNYTGMRQLCYSGLVDDVRLYNRELSPTEVYGLWSAACSAPDDDSDASTACVPCGAGSYAARGSQGPCTACDSYTTDADSDASTPCVACGPGHFVGATASRGSCSSLQCAAGWTDDDWNVATACVQCGAGAFVPAGSAGACALYQCESGTVDDDGDAGTACVEACTVHTTVADCNGTAGDRDRMRRAGLPSSGFACGRGLVDADGNASTPCVSACTLLNIPAVCYDSEHGCLWCGTHCTPYDQCSIAYARTPPTEGLVLHWTFDESGGSALQLSPRYDIDLYTWFHVAYTYDGSALVMYLNGLPSARAERRNISFGSGAVLALGLDPTHTQMCYHGAYDDCGAYMCAGGTFDDDSDPATPCAVCAAGQFSYKGFAVACMDCSRGSTDDDRDPSTPCIAVAERLRDSWGNSYNATIASDPDNVTWLAGRVGSGAIGFMPSYDYENNPGQMLPGTVCPFVRSLDWKLAGSDAMMLEVIGGNSLQFSAASSSWVHVTLVYDGITAIVFVNGAMAAKKAMAISLPPNPTLMLAKAPIDNFYRVCLGGAIDDVRLYNRALTSAEAYGVFHGFCGPGHYVPAGNASDCAALVCPAGTVDHDADTSTACALCSPGHYTPYGSAGHYFASSATIGTCDAFACPAGTQDTDDNVSTPCIPCGPAHYSPLGAHGACESTLCAAGTTDDDWDPATPCLACSTGHFAARDDDSDAATPCFACGAGTGVGAERSTGPCSGYACLAGWTDDDNTSATASHTCLSGWTDDDWKASTPCVPCGAGGYEAAGSAGPCVIHACGTGSVDHDANPTTLCVAECSYIVEQGGCTRSVLGCDWCGKYCSVRSLCQCDRVGDAATCLSSNNCTWCDHLSQCHTGTRGRLQYHDEVQASEILLGEVIGQGSFGVVHKALWRDTEVAAKTVRIEALQAQDVELVAKEVDVMRALRHPNILLYMCYARSADSFIIVTEYMPMGSLMDLLVNESVVIALRMRLAIMSDIALGMAYLHHNDPPILHRDLKSSNILLDSNMQAKVSDFGLTLFAQRGSSHKGCAAVIGTILWTAPEVLDGAACTPQSDVYSFGIIAWEIITREVPYDDCNPHTVAMRVVKEGLRPSLECGQFPSPIADLIAQCWDNPPDVALVFTDIQGSTSLWEWDPVVMKASLKLHNKIMRKCISAHRGFEVKTEGDAYIHESSILHRDLKAANILIGDKWEAKITDFGLSSIKNANKTMTVCGTVAWMAPEILERGHFSEKSDLYALGMVMIGDFLPHRGMLSVSSGRLWVLVTLVQVSLSATRAFLPDRLLWAHALASLLCCAALAWTHWQLLPFWRKLTNCAVGAVLASLAVASVPQLAAAVVADSIVPFCLCVSALVPAAVAAFFVFRLRLRHWERFFVQDIPASAIKIAKPEDLELMLRRIYNVGSPACAEAMVPRALELVSVAKEMFQRDGNPHLEHARILFEVAHDPKGAVLHLRSAKRLHLALDKRYLASSLLQMCQSANQEAQQNEEVQLSLNTVSKHHKMCRMSTARFWQLLVRSHSDTMDIEQLVQHVRRAGYHQHKSQEMLQELLSENPHSVPVLRAWARHLVELQNDKEAAEQVLIMADQMEEDISRHERRAQAKELSHARDETIVTVEDAEEPADRLSTAQTREVRFSDTRTFRVMIEGASGKPLELCDDSQSTKSIAKPDVLSQQQQREEVDEKSRSSLSGVSMSSGASAGTLQAEFTAHARSMRRKIETARSNFLTRLHVAVLVTLGVLIAGTTVNYATSVSTLDGYRLSLEELADTIVSETDSLLGVLKMREYELALMSGNVSVASEHCQRAIEAMAQFESSFNRMYKYSDSFTIIGDHWAEPLVLLIYVPSNLSDYASGTTYNESMHLFEAGYDLISAVDIVCNTSLERMGVPNFRAVPAFRFLMDNGPTVFLESLHLLGDKYGILSFSEAYRVHHLLYAFFPATVVATLGVLALVYLPVLSHVDKERRSVVKLFLDIPKSTLINTCEKLAVNDEDRSVDTASVQTHNSLKSTYTLTIMFGAGICLLLAVCTAIFALSITFTMSDQHQGYSLAAASTRRTALMEMLLWSKELIVGDPTMGTRSEILSRFDDSFAEYTTADNKLKYGIMSVASDIRNDHDLESLWFRRPTIRMLLFLPVNVLDSVESIHDFLEMGRSASEIEAQSDKDQERVTKSIVDACEDIVILCNQNKAIELFNPVAESLTGYSVQEALGQDLSLVVPTDIEANKRLFSNVFGEDKNVKAKISSEVVIKKQDGTLFSSLVSVSRTVVHGKIRTALFIRDITAIKDREQVITRERNRAEGLLLNIFPKEIAEQLNSLTSVADKERERGCSMLLADQFAEATVLFADIAGFTNMSSKLSAEKIVTVLNGVFSLWDNLLEQHSVEKIKTIGDAYMAVCGVPVRRRDHAELMMRFAVAMLGSLREYNGGTDTPVSVRIGINSGPVVAGIIGTKKIAYDLWGDTVNVASRMEHNGVVGCVQVTEDTYQRLRKEFAWECRGPLQIQGKGELVCYVHRPSEESATNKPPSANECETSEEAMKQSALPGVVKEDSRARLAHCEFPARGASTRRLSVSSGLSFILGGQAPL
eukprot:m51a1_g6475 putative adenylate guanylate cyclase (2810) ;mRNA; f:78846-93655